MLQISATIRSLAVVHPLVVLGDVTIEMRWELVQSNVVAGLHWLAVEQGQQIASKIGAIALRGRDVGAAHELVSLRQLIQHGSWGEACTTLNACLKQNYNWNLVKCD